MELYEVSVSDQFLLLYEISNLSSFIVELVFTRPAASLLVPEPVSGPKQADYSPQKSVQHTKPS